MSTQETDIILPDGGPDSQEIIELELRRKGNKNFHWLIESCKLCPHKIFWPLLLFIDKIFWKIVI